MYHADVYTPIALRLHAFGLERIQDPNWTGLELFDKLKRPVRRSGFLTTFQKDGFLYSLGNLLFRDYLVNDFHAEELKGEYLVWYLDNYVAFLRYHGADKGRRSLTRLDDLVTSIDDMYTDDEDKYWRKVDSSSVQARLYGHFCTLKQRNESLLERVAPLYAANYADRVFHDRELCHYLSQLIVSIGFDGMESPHDTEPKKWMNRVSIPVWAKELVQARDRGHCAECRTAISLELEADDHFDHMVPLSRGGCNDIVNLQLLCSKCNLRKSSSDVPVYSSIPPYLRRYHREQ